MTMAADPENRGATMAMHSSVGFSLSALGAWAVGIALDAAGGPSNASARTAALAWLGFSYSIPVLLLAWLLLGAGMGLGLYDAAFATLGRIYGDAARRSITGITLLAGFASTIGWPLTAWGLESIGWRDT